MAGKKDKEAKPKRGKSSREKTSTATDGSTTLAEVDPYALDPSFYRGNSQFKFPNGDTYEGDFCAHLSGLVWREGIGTYTTADGQVYKGRWDGDKLVENQDIEIMYPNGTQFFGNIFKNKYSGPGIYHLEEKVSLVCDFQENKPTGEITLIDPNEKVWHGVAEKNDALLLPEHAFYKTIPENRGKGRAPRESTRKKSVSKVSIKSESQKEPEEEVLNKYGDWRWLEEQIFAKSTMTEGAAEFEESEWYKNYVKFRDKYEPVVLKVQESGEESLDFEERSWYIKYKKFQQNYTKMMQKIKTKKLKHSTSVENFFQLIHSAEYKEKNKPVPVFYPSPKKSEEQCDLCTDLSCYGE